MMLDDLMILAQNIRILAQIFGPAQIVFILLPAPIFCFRVTEPKLMFCILFPTLMNHKRVEKGCRASVFRDEHLTFLIIVDSGLEPEHIRYDAWTGVDDLMILAQNINRETPLQVAALHWRTVICRGKHKV